jgi:hypothetical protein
MVKGQGMSTQPRLQNERGAIIIHVAMALLALIAFNAFVIDLGAMLVSRRQAQNVADAGALAGAVSLVKDGGGYAEAAQSAQHWASDNLIWGLSNSVANVDVTLSGSSGTCGTGCSVAPIPPCADQPGCVRVDVFRNMPDRAGVTRGTALPTFFGHLVGVGQQGVRATATAEAGAGNQIQCLLPFAVIDRWADNYDENVDTTYFPNDGQTGTDGWTPNDHYQEWRSAKTPVKPANDDVYVAPYGNNPNHTGWRVAVDFGRQLILKDGEPGHYSTGWSNLVYLPGSTGGNDVGEDIKGCNLQPVGIAKAENPCTVGDEPNGCITVKPGVTQGPVSAGIDYLYNQDTAARWNPTAPGPTGPDGGAIVGGQGMSSPRIRPLVVVDINHYDDQKCGGSGCIAKVANIIGFFVEGMCGDVEKRGDLDDGMLCDPKTKNKDVVGRIVTIPGVYATGGTGSVDQSAAFVKVIRLVR